MFVNGRNEYEALINCGSKVDKQQVLKIASRLFRTQITSHHIADAALAGLAACLHLRSHPETEPTDPNPCKKKSITQIFAYKKN